MSIQDQSFKNFEVWIIDGGSSDNTVKFLQSLKDPFHWISEPDKGVYDAMNKGIALSKGQWLYFLGADDSLFNPTTLSSIFSKPIPHEKQMIIGRIKYDLKTNDNVYTHNNEGLIVSSWSKKLWIKNALHHQAVFYKKILFSNLKYDLKYHILADHALNLQLYKKKVDAKIIDTIISICGTDGQSKKYHWKMYKEEIDLKVAVSSYFFKPIFVIIGYIKYLLKKTNI
ncbi:MAG: glycosyltransferase [Flavobacteriaceae bacterium]|nr:glycosyltransferase [Flavobacteriaceae bacterium]